MAKPLLSLSSLLQGSTIAMTWITPTPQASACGRVQAPGAPSPAAGQDGVPEHAEAAQVEPEMRYGRSYVLVGWTSLVAAGDTWAPFKLNHDDRKIESSNWRGFGRQELLANSIENFISHKKTVPRHGRKFTKHLKFLTLNGSTSEPVAASSECSQFGNSLCRQIRPSCVP